MNIIKYRYMNMPKQAKASFWFAVCSFIQKAISLITTPVFSRLLSTSEFGVFNVYNTWQSIILIFASLNLASGVYVRGLIKYEEDSEEFTASLQSLYVLNMTIVFVIYLVFSDFWSSLLDLKPLYLIMMFFNMYATTAFHFWSARQRVCFEYRKLVILTLINAVLKPSLGVASILCFPSDKVATRIVSITIADLLVFGYLFIRIFIGKEKKFSTKYWKYALLYNLPLVPHYLSQIVLNQSDRIMIKSLCSASEAGIYSLAYTAASILLIVNQSILNSYNPWMYKKIKNAEYEGINKVSMSLLLAIACINLALIGFAPEAVMILAPSAYHEAIYVIPPVTMSVFFTFMYSLFSNFEFYFEKTKIMMFASVGGALLNIILNYFVIQIFGYMAAGYTTLVCYLLYCLFHYCAMKIILNRELKGMKIYNLKTIVLIGLSFTILSFVFLALYDHLIIRYCIIAVALITVFIFRIRIIRFAKSILNLK